MINNKEMFFQKINQNSGFTNEIFDLDNQTLIIQHFNSPWVKFNDCTFNCDQLNFHNIKNLDLVLEFKNCTFNCNISFSNCIFYRLSFNNTKNLKSLNVRKGLSDNNMLELNVFEFSNNTNNNKRELNTEFHISNTEIKDTFSFENINHIDGKFKFLENKLGNKEKEKGQFMFTNSTFTNAFFSRNHFNELTTFYNTTFKCNPRYLSSSNARYPHTRFYKNTFEKVNFSNSNFFDKCDFDKCDFLSTTWFEECKNLSNSKLKFVACEFKGFSLFNKSKINVLDIDRCTFHKSSSFTDAEFNTLKLFEVKFGGGAYFDEMKINKVLDKSYLKAKNEKILEWKRTLRAIKQELQKTENKIDFNRFRSYELAAHYKELSLWRNFKDTSILWSTKWTTDFGLSWTRAFWFTILSGLFWYSILYRIENSGVFNSEKVNDFFVGAFRFFLVTDFYNPLETDRVYLTNPLSWFVFILGKIVIAFGIYEMIQSFRKFKA